MPSIAATLSVHAQTGGRAEPGEARLQTTDEDSASLHSTSTARSRRRRLARRQRRHLEYLSARSINKSSSESEDVNIHDSDDHNDEGLENACSASSSSSSRLSLTPTPSDVGRHHFDTLTADPMTFHDIKSPTLELRFINTLDTTNWGPWWAILDLVLSLAFACIYVVHASKYVQLPMPRIARLLDFYTALLLLLQFLPKLFFYYPSDGMLRRLTRVIPLLTILTTVPTLIVRSPLVTWNKHLPVYFHWHGYMSDYVLFFWPLRFLRLFVSTLKVLKGVDRGDGVFRGIHIGVVRIKLFSLLMGILCTLLTCTGFLHIIEFKYENMRTLSFFDAFFFTYLIATTISYESTLVPDDPFPRIIILSIVFVGLAYVPYAVSEVVSALRQRSRFDRNFSLEARQQHVLLIGAVNEVFTLRHFFEEFLCLDHGESVISTKIVILDPHDPTQKVLRLITQPQYLHRVQWVRGSTLSHTSYRRVNLDKAVACFMLARKYASESRSVDAENVLKSMALVKFCPSLKLYVQCLLPDSKDHFYNFADQVICIDELKLAVLAHSVICPGFSTLIYFLTTSLVNDTYSNSNTASQQNRAMKKAQNEQINSIRSRLSMQRLMRLSNYSDDTLFYRAHCESQEFARDTQLSQEQAIYPTTLSTVLIGHSFIAVSDILFREHGILLFGLGIPTRLMMSPEAANTLEDAQGNYKSSIGSEQFSICLNPENYELKGGEIGFVIAKDAAETEKVRSFNFSTKYQRQDAPLFAMSPQANPLGLSVTEQTPLLYGDSGTPLANDPRFSQLANDPIRFSPLSPDPHFGLVRTNTIAIQSEDIVEYGETFPSLHTRRHTVRDRINARRALEKSRHVLLSSIPEDLSGDDSVSHDRNSPRVGNSKLRPNIGFPRAITTPLNLSQVSYGQISSNNRPSSAGAAESSQSLRMSDHPGLHVIPFDNPNTAILSRSLPPILHRQHHPHYHTNKSEQPFTSLLAHSSILSSSPGDMDSPPALTARTNSSSDPSNANQTTNSTGQERSSHHRRRSITRISTRSPVPLRSMPFSSADNSAVDPPSPASPIASMAVNMLDSLVDHVLVCNSSDHFPANLPCFIAPLRAPHMSKISPVVIICPIRPSASQWQILTNFTDVYYVQGNPLNRTELMLARPQCAARVVVLADDSKVIGTGEKIDDANAVMVVLNLKAVCPPSVFIVVEFVHNETMRFLTEFDAVGDITEDSIAYNSPSFLAGNVFTVSMLDSIIAQAYYNPHLVTILKLLLWTAPPSTGSMDSADNEQTPMFLAKHSHVFQIPIPSLFVGQDYGSLFSWLIHHFKAVPIGLFRMAQWEVSQINVTSFRYVALSPRVDTIIHGGDRVFILSKNEPEIEQV